MQCRNTSTCLLVFNTFFAGKCMRVRENRYFLFQLNIFCWHRNIHLKRILNEFNWFYFFFHCRQSNIFDINLCHLDCHHRTHTPTTGALTASKLKVNACATLQHHRAVLCVVTSYFIIIYVWLCSIAGALKNPPFVWIMIPIHFVDDTDDNNTK